MRAGGGPAHVMVGGGQGPGQINQQRSSKSSSSSQHATSHSQHRPLHYRLRSDQTRTELISVCAGEIWRGSRSLLYLVLLVHTSGNIVFIAAPVPRYFKTFLFTFSNFLKISFSTQIPSYSRFFLSGEIRSYLLAKS